MKLVAIDAIDAAKAPDLGANLLLLGLQTRELILPAATLTSGELLSPHAAHRTGEDMLALNRAVPALEGAETAQTGVSAALLDRHGRQRLANFGEVHGRHLLPLSET